MGAKKARKITEKTPKNQKLRLAYGWYLPDAFSTKPLTKNGAFLLEVYKRVLHLTTGWYIPQGCDGTNPDRYFVFWILSVCQSVCRPIKTNGRSVANDKNCNRPIKRFPRQFEHLYSVDKNELEIGKRRMQQSHEARLQKRREHAGQDATVKQANSGKSVVRKDEQQNANEHNGRKNPRES